MYFKLNLNEVLNDWPITITPLDTCGLVKLKGNKYHTVKDLDSIPVKDVIENYKIWDTNYGLGLFEKESSVLFDTVAVFLALSDNLLDMQEQKLEIDDDGYMQEIPNGKPVNVAIRWKNLDMFEDFLIERYCNSYCTI